MEIKIFPGSEEYAIGVGPTSVTCMKQRRQNLHPQSVKVHINFEWKRMRIGCSPESGSRHS
jgi:hypothetical protein